MAPKSHRIGQDGPKMALGWHTNGKIPSLFLSISVFFVSVSLFDLLSLFLLFHQSPQTGMLLKDMASVGDI